MGDILKDPKLDSKVLFNISINRLCQNPSNFLYGVLIMIEGTCLCGSVTWQLDGTPDGATVCNCTACRRYGVLWAYGYVDEDVKTRGETRAYVRGKALEFHFCPNCGCVAFWRGLQKNETGKTRIAVNLRLSEPTAVAHIPIDHFDGLDTFDDLPRDGKCVADYWS